MDDAPERSVGCATDWAPTGDGADPTDLEVPNLARAMNYLLGGAANFAADRRAVDEILRFDTTARARIRDGRAFLGRALRVALARGHDQFLDLGAGIPSAGGVHTVVRAAHPTARVVYVDRDPVAVAHGRGLLRSREDTGRITVTRADLLDVPAVLRSPEVAEGIDLARPVVLVCTSVLQWIGEDVREAFALYREALAPGSLVILSHPGATEAGRAVREGMDLTGHVLGGVRLREPDELRVILDGWDVLEPGIVDVTDWPVATDAPRAGFWGLCATRP